MHGLTCDVLLQLVNYAQFTQTVALRIKHSPVPISAVGNVTVLTGLDYQSTNSFQDPHNVSSCPLPCILPFHPFPAVSCQPTLHASCPYWILVEDLKHGDNYYDKHPVT